MSNLELVSSSRCFGGEVRKYSHASTSTKGKMLFNIFLPDVAIAGKEKVPVLYYLSGLTCNEDNMVTKGGAIPFVSKERIALVTPDTSPRGAGVEGEEGDWELGTGAGFYVDATQEPWRTSYNMYTYVQKELQTLVSDNFSVDSSRTSVFGHSMGGHGALVLALRNPGHYRSASGFAPICHPSTSNWGRKQFTAYLGNKEEDWAEYDATELVKRYEGPVLPILIDQGDADQFYSSKQLQPSHFVIATESSRRPVDLETRMQHGYDHSYWFIQTFMEDHIAFHAKHLKA
ncbi:esterase [Martensiomyces pterosporus]|nr:esterase [Martensiomyces pterosporus]